MKATAYLPAFLEILQASQDLDGLLNGALRYIVGKYDFSLGMIVAFEPIARHVFYRPAHLQPRLDPVKIDALCEGLERVRDFRQVVGEENEERFDLVLGGMLGDGKEKFLLFPLVAEEKIMGFLSLARRAALPELDEADRSILSVMVRQIVMELSRELALQKEKQLAREGAFLLELGKAVIADLDLEEVLSRVVRASLDLLELSRCTVFVLGEDKEHPRVLYSYDPDNPGDVNVREMEPGLDFHGKAGELMFLEGKTVYVEDALTDPLANNETARLFNTVSPLGVPLIYQGEVTGAIYIDEPGQYHHFTDEDIRIMEGIAAIAAIAVENARLYQESREQQGRLADLMLRLARAREEERSRISRELHDSMAQTLLEIIYRAEGLLGTASGDHLRQELRGMLRAPAPPWPSCAASSPTCAPPRWRCWACPGRWPTCWSASRSPTTSRWTRR